jgi:glutaredoxin
MSNYLTVEQMQEIANTKNVIFFKNGCPFCNASIVLLDELKSAGKIDEYVVYVLDKDFENDNLGQLARNNGWVADGGQDYPSKPQIFMKGEYIGGNFEFYKSKWNVGEGMPNLNNPMRF